MKRTKVDKARLAGFVVAILASFPLGLLISSELFRLPIWVGLAVLLACNTVLVPVFYRKVVCVKIED